MISHAKSRQPLNINTSDVNSLKTHTCEMLHIKLLSALRYTHAHTYAFMHVHTHTHTHAHTHACTHTHTHTNAQALHILITQLFKKEKRKKEVDALKCTHRCDGDKAELILIA